MGKPVLLAPAGIILTRTAAASPSYRVQQVRSLSVLVILMLRPQEHFDPRLHIRSADWRTHFRQRTTTGSFVPGGAVMQGRSGRVFMSNMCAAVLRNRCPD